jgi:hypothetical protein
MKLLAYVVVVAMAASALYAAYTSVAYWSGIGV